VLSYLHSFPTRRSSDLLLSGVVPYRRSGTTDGWKYNPILEQQNSSTLVDMLQRLQLQAQDDPASLAPFVTALLHIVATPLDERRDRKSTRLNSSHVKIS